ncbi:MAG: hypothetical protein IJX12_07480, partial [Lachnospiraceae bacterium]|nr:hypothetical protein [Lachnospiraceae bacterium]
TPCVALDNISKKVSGVHKWICDLEYIKVIDNEEEIEGGITELFQMEPKTFKADIVQAEFEKMASKIKDWCEL